MCIHERLNMRLNSTGAVSATKTVFADGILNQSPAGVEPTSFSDLSATSISVPWEQVWLITAAGTQAQFPLTFQNINRLHDALLSTNNVALIVYPWHWRWSMCRNVLFYQFLNSVIKGLWLVWASCICSTKVLGSGFFITEACPVLQTC